MIVEHSFVSTMPCDELMAAARSFLGARGFEPVPQSAEEANRLLVQRGNRKAGRTQAILELPQRVQLDWDRGRVNVALSITPNVQTTRSFALSGASTVSSSSNKLRLHAALMMAIANALEMHLAGGMPDEQAAAEWTQLETELAEKGDRDERRRSWKIVGIFFLVILLPIAICILLLWLLPKH